MIVHLRRQFSEPPEIVLKIDNLTMQKTTSLLVPHMLIKR